MNDSNDSYSQKLTLELEKKIQALNIEIICLENADIQGPEGRAKLRELEQERAQLIEFLSYV